MTEFEPSSEVAIEDNNTAQKQNMDAQNTKGKGEGHHQKVITATLAGSTKAQTQSHKVQTKVVSRDHLSNNSLDESVPGLDGIELVSAPCTPPLVLKRSSGTFAEPNSKRLSRTDSSGIFPSDEDLGVDHVLAITDTPFHYADAKICRRQSKEIRTRKEFPRQQKVLLPT